METTYHLQHRIPVANVADPTATLTLRNQYSAATRRRFDALRRATVAYIRDSFAQIRAMGPLAFTYWLNVQIDRLILEVERDVAGAILTASNWQLPFVETAFLRGVAFADRQLSGSGFITIPLEFLGIRPYGAEIEAALARNFADLQNITQEMSRQVELEIGAASDWLTMAAGAADRIEKVGRTRGETMSRTMVIWAFAEATLTRYAAAGIGMVTGLVELVTAGGACPLCLGLRGVYTIEQARGLLPRHPRCRCAWTPYLGSRVGVGVGVAF